jgi:two-component system sensor histidine kinase KdpD
MEPGRAVELERRAAEATGARRPVTVARAQVRDGPVVATREDQGIATTNREPPEVTVTAAPDAARAVRAIRVPSSILARIVLACAAVSITAVTLHVGGADEITATSVLFVVVVLAALCRVPAGPTALVLTCVLFDLWWVRPIGGLVVRRLEDFAPLAAFVIAATVCGIVVSRLDTMRRRAQEHERAAFRAEIDAAINENRAAFLSAMTHNLRTPLASIKAAAATLASPALSVPPERRARLLTTIHDEADRLERLVTKVLELSRVHAGALEARLEPTDVAELVGTAVLRLRHVAGATSIRFDVEGDPLLADADPAMLEVALVSLLENALRFGPPGSEVVVHAGALHGACVISIIDHGPGIPPGDRERVFDEFVQLESADTGAGLGLAIARAFVEAQSGTVTVEETNGGGATFAITVPIDGASR